MSGSGPAYRYSVEREPGSPGVMDVALVRHPASHGLLDRIHRHERQDEVVMFHRTFRPLLELAELETYAEVAPFAVELR